MKALYRKTGPSFAKLERRLLQRITIALCLVLCTFTISAIPVKRASAQQTARKSSANVMANRLIQTATVETKSSKAGQNKKLIISPGETFSVGIRLTASSTVPVRFRVELRRKLQQGVLGFNVLSPSQTNRKVPANRIALGFAVKTSRKLRPGSYVLRVIHLGQVRAEAVVIIRATVYTPVTKVEYENPVSGETLEDIDEEDVSTPEYFRVGKPGSTETERPGRRFRKLISGSEFSIRGFTRANVSGLEVDNLIVRFKLHRVGQPNDIIFRQRRDLELHTDEHIHWAPFFATQTGNAGDNPLGPGNYILTVLRDKIVPPNPGKIVRIRLHVQNSQ